MRKLSFSTKTFFLLVLIYAFCAGIGLYLPQGDFEMQSGKLPAPKYVVSIVNAIGVFVIYGLVGLLGLYLSLKIDIPEVWDEKVKNTQRFLIPMYFGIGLGVFLIAGDVIFSKYNGTGYFPHPPFPTSIVASYAAGVGEEIMFRLFFVSFWTWLFSKIIFRGKWQSQTFWTVAVISALSFSLLHLPMISTLNIKPNPVLLSEVLLMNGVVSIFCAGAFRKYGFLGAVGIHFWTDIVWHVAWGSIKQ